jgi:hypothetical protein
MDKGTTKIDTSNISGELFPLSSISGKSVEFSFTAPDLSSQGGLLFMREYAQTNDFIGSICSHIEDSRTPYLVKHSYQEMLTQRIYQIAAGYEDADDCDLLRNDSILKMCCGRTPDGAELSSQPTMTRLENKLTTRELYNIGIEFVLQFIASYDKEPEVIILDCDDTNFDTHGCQQGSLFNNYYDEYCYMPLLIFEGVSGKMILPMLREGRRSKVTNIKGVLVRLIRIMRQHWKNTKFIIRGDGHFCSYPLMDWVRDNKLEEEVFFITGLTGNSVLNKRCEDWVKSAQKRFKYDKVPIKFYKSFTYQAGSWKYAQRVIVKIEVTTMGTNIRYIVTNFRHGNSRFLYEEAYCGRGKMELYIKELKTYLDANRTSCHKFKANQFRLFLHAAAYVLLHGLKSEILPGTALEKASILSIREKLLLTAAHIRQLKTKIKIEFPQNHILKDDIRKFLHKFQKVKTAA